VGRRFLETLEGYKKKQEERVNFSSGDERNAGWRILHEHYRNFYHTMLSCVKRIRRRKGEGLLKRRRAKICSTGETSETSKE